MQSHTFELFAERKLPYSMILPQAQITHVPKFLDFAIANAFFEHLKANLPWKQEPIWLYGRQVMQPRMTAWFGETPMHYSGIAMPPSKWDEDLLMLKDKVSEFVQVEFNSVLANLYRDGNDSVSWHTDAEPILGQNPIIASLSLGAERTFKYKHRTLDIQESITLTNGSLLVMGGEMQHHWLHSVPKVANAPSRINLTFRKQMTE
jgi:alkylated DNA repair dioxygenase AlkB